MHRHGVDVERVRVIAPLRALVAECQKICRGRDGWTSELIEERCDAIHRAQGKEADVVALVLGGGRRVTAAETEGYTRQDAPSQATGRAHGAVSPETASRVWSPTLRRPGAELPDRGRQPLSVAMGCPIPLTVQNASNSSPGPE
ncbi:hypothetical protein GCM10010347_32100 [Streptomyces cirratus]|uniref:Uncharacterized protein n=1 Tax=Streptomyces cirratus TaxID=68187 RepID=A0ABQ3ET53_9ACTN|nr:hypothetical protein GCM10010347_32100 [Streptomyces cirratus]